MRLATTTRLYDRGSELVSGDALTCYEREDMIFNPLHYLALLEQKPNALDQAAPLAHWVLSEGLCADRLHRCAE
jgi:hypothetical protein